MLVSIISRRSINEIAVYFLQLWPPGLHVLLQSKETTKPTRRPASVVLTRFCWSRIPNQYVSNRLVRLEGFAPKTSQSMRAVSSPSLIYITKPYELFCVIWWQIRHNYNRLDDGHCDVTGYRKMSALSTAGAMVTTHVNSVKVWPFKGPKLFSVLLNIMDMKKKWWASNHIVLFKLNLISNLRRISDWSVHSESNFFHSTGTFAVSTDSPLRR